MSYVLFAPRTTNYFPGGPPYLAGLRGLGDYASDLAAYNSAIAKWRLAKLSYDSALKRNAAKVKGIDAAYAAALATYNADKAAWDNEYAAYLVAMKSWVASVDAAKKANTQRSLTIASSYGLNLSQSYYDNGACLTQAQHDAYARQCTTVKGLGHLRGLGSSDSDCGMKALPVCQFGPPPTVRAKPTPPTRAAYPANPVSPGPAPVAPTPPAATTTPASSGGGSPTPIPVPATPLPEAPGPDEALPESKQANVLMNGLILVAVIGGGYLVYRTLRKPKAAA